MFASFVVVVDINDDNLPSITFRTHTYVLMGILTTRSQLLSERSIIQNSNCLCKVERLQKQKANTHSYVLGARHYLLKSKVIMAANLKSPTFNLGRILFFNGEGNL